jgi:hypothetical protein
MFSAKLSGDEGIEESQFPKYWGTFSFVVKFDGRNIAKPMIVKRLTSKRRLIRQNLM